LGKYWEATPREVSTSLQQRLVFSPESQKIQERGTRTAEEVEKKKKENAKGKISRGTLRPVLDDIERKRMGLWGGRPRRNPRRQKREQVENESEFKNLTKKTKSLFGKATSTAVESSAEKKGEAGEKIGLEQRAWLNEIK